MESLENLKLSEHDKAIVKSWLQSWLNHFINLANGKEGNVKRANFETMDFFYFTDCADLMTEDVESKAIENDVEIRKRKRVILFQLLIKTLLGETIENPIKCSHCGYPKCDINGTVNGHYVYCPRCEKVNLVGYKKTLLHSFLDVEKRLNNA